MGSIFGRQQRFWLLLILSSRVDHSERSVRMKLNGHNGFDSTLSLNPWEMIVNAGALMIKEVIAQ